MIEENQDYGKNNGQDQDQAQVKNYNINDKKINKQQLQKLNFLQHQFQSLLIKHKCKHVLKYTYRIFDEQIPRLCEIIDQLCRIKTSQTKEQFNIVAINKRLLYLQFYLHASKTDALVTKFFFHSEFENMSMLSLESCNISNIQFLVYLNCPKLHNIFLQNNHISKVSQMTKASLNISQIASIHLTDNCIKEITCLSRCFSPSSKTIQFYIDNYDDYDDDKCQFQGIHQLVKVSLSNLTGICNNHNGQNSLTGFWTENMSTRKIQVIKNCFLKLYN